MARDYGTENWIDWCPGCGNFGIVSSVYRAFSELEVEPENTVVVSGIGCSGKMPHFIDVNGVHTLHGRAIPFATGIKMADPKLKVVVNGGDGDLLGIGAGHFVALGRRNLDVLVMMHDNRVYGLTKGQASPTLPRDTKTKALNTPSIQDAVEPLALALTSGYTHVARSFAMDSDHLKESIKDGMEHEGAAFLNILQPCVTYNDIHTSEYFNERIDKLEDWDPEDIDPTEAMDRSRIDEEIPIGLFYRDTETPTFEERIAEQLPSYQEKAPAEQDIEKNGKTILDQETFRSKFKGNLIRKEK
ncbi:MAG: 2-oxoacid:ferredoxin oxidoreductase subunit beta [Candidatus Thermoplasmatota archaeon]|nr:2-oxoacid:ferredoxin oxidoreductase subunit beta [Candidatus Thermoplasmatota archaeon]MBS3790657.1 2-oxoacid:ferredoxin oxidoreductase subunit beta [Candidatus Thermoplasmatota archaeon]